jgi:hypothetical protein
VPRHLLDDLIAGQLTTWTVTRAKCRFGPNHESVRLVGDEWWGEDSRDIACALAPPDPCATCAGAGEVELVGDELAMARQSGGPTRRPCTPCGGLGRVPGPHWPWRWPQPPPLRVEE